MIPVRMGLARARQGMREQRGGLTVWNWGRQGGRGRAGEQDEPKRRFWGGIYSQNRATSEEIAKISTTGTACAIAAHGNKEKMSALFFQRAGTFGGDVGSTQGGRNGWARKPTIMSILGERDRKVATSGTRLGSLADPVCKCGTNVLHTGSARGPGGDSPDLSSHGSGMGWHALIFVVLLAFLVKGGNGGDIMMGESSPMMQRLRAAAEATKRSSSSDGAGSKEGSSAVGAGRRLPAGAGTTTGAECRVCGGSCSRKETTRCPRCW
jgi:hypothetical protein